MDRDAVDNALARLPEYHTVKDLVAVFGGKAALLDAYVDGWLSPVAEQTLEGNYAQLQCWLMARLLRLAQEEPPRLP